MKTRTILIVALVLISAGTLLAKPGKGKEKGWPNAGITEPGHPKHGPNAYGSPGRKPHP